MFDFDGVIADSLDVFYTEFSSAVRELGYERMNSKEALLKLFEGNVLAQLIKAGFPIWKLKQLGRKFAPRIAAANARVRPFPGMPELLAEIAARHAVYIISSNTTEAVELFLQRHAISGVRDVLGADKETSKVKKIQQVRRLHPELTPWYIGDTKGDMLEAHSARAIAVAVTWGWHSEELLASARPHHVVRSQAELRALFLTP
jgi:phosphoglycolate phosphatase